MGQVHYAQGNLEQAYKHASSAVDLALKLRTPLLTYLSMTLLGKVQRARGELEAAMGSFRAAINAVETMRDGVAGGEREQQLFFEDKLTPYHEMVSILEQKDDAWGALEYAEMAKGRVLSDVLRNGRQKVSEGLSQAEIEQERKLNGSMISLNSQLRTLRSGKTVDEKMALEVEGRLEAARHEFETFEMGLYAAHPRLRVQQGRLEPFTRKAAVALLNEPNTAILNYRSGGRSHAAVCDDDALETSRDGSAIECLFDTDQIRESFAIGNEVSGAGRGESSGIPTSRSRAI